MCDFPPANFTSAKGSISTSGTEIGEKPCVLLLIKNKIHISQKCLTVHNAV